MEIQAKNHSIQIQCPCVKGEKLQKNKGEKKEGEKEDDFFAFVDIVIFSWQ